jgi:two-component system NtrC family sensor kinase
MSDRAVADRIKVLVVGDDIDRRHAVTRTLDATPGILVVGVVASGSDTLAAVARLRPDIVLIDLSIPLMDAVDCARRIKAGPHLPKVLLVTADEDAVLCERVTSVAIDGHVTRQRLEEGALAAIRATIGAPSLGALFGTPRAVMRSLADATRVLSASLDEADVFRRVATSGADLIGAPVAALWLADERARTLTLVAWSDEMSGHDWAPPALRYGTGGIGRVAEHRQVQDRADVITDDAFLLSESRQWADRHGLPSALMAPIVLGGELLAVLALFGTRPFEFGPDEHELLDAFTALAAATLATSRSHQEAVRDRDFHRSVAEHAAEAIIATDAAGRVTYINPRAEAMFECRAGRALGRDVKALAAHGEVDPAIVTAIETHLRQGVDVREQDLTIARHGGQLLDATISVRRLPGIGGEAGGCVFVVRDVTDIRATLRNLQQTERLSVMGLLVAGVAHELSNPLQIVTGYADLLLSNTGEQPRIADHAEQILRAANRCSRIVENFLSLARRRPQGWQAVAMNAVVQDALELVAYQLRLDGIDVRQDLAADLPEVWGDAHELHQVIVNLIVNARHALRRSPGTRLLRVSTRAAGGGTGVVVEVADSGPGVPPALRERIFEPFFTTAPSGEGTGLGLPLCHSIVAAHGGSLTLASASGAGATFLVELPGRLKAPSSDSATASTTSHVTGRRVLVVDDEQEVGALIAAFLGLDGHLAHVERDAEVALDRLAEMPFDAVLVDIHMPGMDGIEFYGRLEQVAPHLARRVVFVTGDTLSAGEFLVERGLTTLGKPFGREALRAALRRVLEG